ncbi:MAG: hypothetical protein BroJett025_11350 [Patescibacteria group bacterium]|nr:MAG: hypothetical protein BroJett025_11350 [Patescibacteria group bacterium]
MDTQSLFKKVSLFSVLAIGVLSTLLLVPVTDSFIEHSKLYTLLFGALVVLFLFIVKTFKERAVRVSVSPVSGALLLFALATVAATFFTSDYPVEGLLGLGGLFLSTSVIALLGGSIMPKDVASKFLCTLTGTSVALTVLSILQMLGFGPAQLINRTMGFELPSSLNFNLAGSPFIALQVVGLTLVAVLAHVVSTKKLSKFYAVTLPVLVIGTGLFAWSLLPGKETTLVLPSFSASWSVMLDTIRAPKSALIGAGVSAYRNAYQIFKPIWINGTQNWAVSFTQATMMPLTIVTTMGIIGLLTWIFVVVKFFRYHKTTSASSKALGVFIGASFLLNLLLPFNTVVLTLQAIAIACLIANESHRLPLLQMQTLRFKMLNKPETLNLNKKPMNIPLYIGTGISLVVILAMGYLVTRSAQAFAVMFQSSQAMANNDVVKAYELQQKAVQLNPYYDVFRRRYSATSALIAIALSNKAEITEAEKQQVSALLQQSVSEARAATTLDAAESQNWSNLAQIYNNLIGVSEDAVNWTVQSYVSAIETNPTDPLLRLDLAAVFVGQKAYQQALSIYDQAVNLKADLAISHYRRGEMLELVETPDAYREARLSYQRALALLPANSEDYVAVTTKIEDLEKFMEENDISLEPETEESAQTGSQAGEEATELSAPSITEQNLNNSDTVTPDAEPVEVDNLSDEQVTTPEQTTP